jgi:diguanylate cyclase (GGDEF)-like protein
LDIDHFKKINDNYGHLIGDEVLKFASDQMRKTIRKQDVCCRIGGEEFVILLSHTGKNKAYELAEYLRKRMEQTMSPGGEIVTVSIGIASYPEGVTDISKLVEKADESLYKAKRMGRNCTVSYVT